MKHILLYILFAGFFSFAVQPAKAAFVVRGNSAVAQAGSVTDISRSASAETKKAEIISENKSAKELVSPTFRRMAYKGWFGMLSLFMGIAGFFYPLFAIGAILFGFIGMSKRNWNTGIAIVGFVLGLAVLSLTIFFGFTPLALF